MALAVAASAGSFLTLEALLPASTPKLAAVYAAAAINLFYWWAAPGPEWVAWPLRDRARRHRLPPAVGRRDGAPALPRPRDARLPAGVERRQLAGHDEYALFSCT